MKPWAYAVIILALIAAVGAVYAKGHSSGYDKRDQEVQREIISAQEDARLKEEAKWTLAVEAALNSTKTEEVIVEKIREVEIEIPTVVERIVELTPECADLGIEYAGLLNDQVRAANSLQVPEIAASLVDRMPGLGGVPIWQHRGSSVGAWPQYGSGGNLQAKALGPNQIH